MTRPRTVLVCLVFSGLSALVYQIIWTRLLGFAFGTTTEAISTVLAVFFGGLALGNFAAARWQARIERPLRVYAWLELAIGAYALLSLPLLRGLDGIFHVVGVPETQGGLLLLRVACAALILLPPTIAMGATLPAAARGLVNADGELGRWSAHLYGANTLGAVLGAYLCGFWLIPELGLTRSLIGAGLVNLAIGALVWKQLGWLRAASAPPAEAASEVALERRAFLLCFGVSGFVAIGYEIVWSKVFGIVMEGTLYGFAAVLSAYLLGIGLGSLAVARRVDRIRDLPRAFALLHVAIGVAVFLGTLLVPLLPYLHTRLSQGAWAGDAVHLLYVLVLPIVLAPTALFGAAFPILIRLHAPGAASAGRSIGIATGVNTLGSIVASAAVGFWWIPTIGTDGSLYALLLIDFAAALVLLAAFQKSRGPSRWGALVGSALVVATITLSFGGVHVEEAVAGRQLRAPDLPSYLRQLDQASQGRAITIEGRSSIVTVSSTPLGRYLRTNGLPEAGMRYAQPYSNQEAVLLGVMPYLLAERSERALVVGLGGGNTLAGLLPTRLDTIDVVELERGVPRAVELMHEGLPNPLEDERVSLRIADGRNDLLLRAARGDPGYDLITSQPSHPWRVGAANLFTEEFFSLARGSLREGGVFAAWLNGFRIDGDALLAVVTSFERVFPGAVLVDVSQRGRQAFLLAGSTRPLVFDLPRMAERLGEPDLGRYLAAYGIGDPYAILARVEGPTSVFAAIDPDASNTDDNAFVETRTPRAIAWQQLDFAAVESRLAPGAPLLPESRGELDVESLARTLLERGSAGPWPYHASLSRLLDQHEDTLPDATRRRLRAGLALRDPAREAEAIAALQALAKEQPKRPEALRVLGRHLAERRQAWREAADAFASAYLRSGDPNDAYDTGRALHPVDPVGATRWFGRIPAKRRADFPRLAFYDALQALEQELSAEALHGRFQALVGYLDTAEGREYPGGHELASRLAWTLGDRASARALADTDAKQRERRARPHLLRASRALDAGELEAARSDVDAAAKLVPGDPRVSTLRARLAQATGRPDELARALSALRRFAPSIADGNAADNHFRTQHGLPLRPEQPGPAAGAPQ